MDHKLKKLLDRQFNFIMNSAYGFPHPKLPDNPKEAFEHYSKLLERRNPDANKK